MLLLMAYVTFTMFVMQAPRSPGVCVCASRGVRHAVKMCVRRGACATQCRRVCVAGRAPLSPGVCASRGVHREVRFFV